MKKDPLITVLGPTASGKSDIAVEIALAHSGEVVSADSRQVYRGMDIGSGKITEEEMREIPHHLLDVADPKERYTASQYKKDAENAISDIHARGNLPILCGGTGFYISSVVNDLEFPEVPPNEELRKVLEKKSTEELFEELQKKDPERAESIDRHNKVRLVRALEIVEHLGAVPTLEKRESPYDLLLIGLNPDRDTLREKIHIRLEQRLKEGMIEEVKELHQRGVSWSRLEELGLEYRYLALYLQDKLTFEEMQTRLESEINHYAKRQMTWFKRDERIRWFDPSKRKEILNTVRKFFRH